MSCCTNRKDGGCSETTPLKSACSPAVLSDSGSDKELSKSRRRRGADCGPEGGDHRRNGASSPSPEARQKQKQALGISIALCFFFMLVEIVGGYVAHSLAIMTDAAHLLTDVGALALSYFAVHVTQQSSNNQFTFGWHRAEIIGALASIFSIWFLTGIILFAAINRMFTFVSCASRGPAAENDPLCESVNGHLMLIVGILGLIVNISLAVILVWGGAKVQHAHSHSGGGHGHDHGHSHGSHGHAHSHAHSHHAHEDTQVNVQSAYLHALGDCINSIGVIIAAIVITWGNSATGGISKTSWYNMADPLTSLIFGVVTLWTTIGLTKEVLEVLMEGVPAGVNYEKVLAGLEALPGVEEVHDLHIWSLTTDQLSLSVHLTSDKHEEVLHAAQNFCSSLKPRGIEHTTIQVDPVNDCCAARCFSSVH